MNTLLVPIALTVLALLVLVADIAPANGNARGTGSLAALGLAAIFVFAGQGTMGDAFVGAWRNDAFTLYAQRLVLLAGLIACIGSIDHADRVFPRRQGEYYLLLLSSILGMTLLAGARDIVLLLVSFELMSIPQYVLAAIHKDGKRGAEGATKLYLTGSISAGLTIYGASFLVGVTGSTSLHAIAVEPMSPLLGVGGLLVLAGLAYKLGAVPFHMWIPDTYQVAPAPFVAFLSVAPKVAGMAALVRLIDDPGSLLGLSWLPVLLVVCFVTLVLGKFIAIAHTIVRRLLAWSGIGHAGLLLLALVLPNGVGVAPMMFYLATYVVSNMGAFLVAETVGDDLPAWKGLARRSPGLALAMLLSLLSLGGIPFVAGFWGKLLLFRQAWLSGQAGLVVLAALLAVVGLFYYLKVARAMYVEAPTSGPVNVGTPTRLAIILALAGVVGMGVMPSLFWMGAAEAQVAVTGRGLPRMDLYGARDQGTNSARKEMGTEPAELGYTE